MLSQIAKNSSAFAARAASQHSKMAARSFSAAAAERARNQEAQAEHLRRVMKFGGSSVGNADALRNVASILIDEKAAGNETVGVLSAMYGVTDRLVEAVDRAKHGDLKKVNANSDDIKLYHEKTIDSMMGDVAWANQACKAYLHETMEEWYRKVTNGIAEKGSFDAYDMDRVSSIGERLSNFLMSAYLRSKGQMSHFVPADKLIVTCGTHGNAEPDLDATRALVQQHLEPLLHDSVPCVTGFFGAGPNGKITTFGRGGSDLTAAVLSNTLSGVDEMVLWKVECEKRNDGWLKTWKPGFTGVVHDADVEFTIPELSYDDAAQLAAFGKKVLHPSTVFPAIEKDIPVYVKNTIDPQHPGTKIHGDVNLDQPVTSITKAAFEFCKNKHEIQMGDFDWANLGVKPETAGVVVLVGQEVSLCENLRSDVTAVLTRNQIRSHIPIRVNGSEHNLCVVVPQEDMKRAVKILHKEVLGYSESESE